MPGAIFCTRNSNSISLNEFRLLLLILRRSRRAGAFWRMTTTLCSCCLAIDLVVNEKKTSFDLVLEEGNLKTLMQYKR